MMPGMPPPPGHMPPFMQPIPYPYMPPPNGLYPSGHVVFVDANHASTAMYPGTPMGQMPRKSPFAYILRDTLRSPCSADSLHAPAWLVPSPAKRCWSKTIHATNPDPVACPPILPPKPTT